MVGNVSPLHCFALCLIVFHLSEVLLVFLIEREELTWSSLLISAPYVTAMCCGLSEHFIGRRFYVPETAVAPCLVTGIILVVIGEALRKAAWLTAQASFTHLIQKQRRPQHKLVVSGVYSFSRHPGYLGWWIWAVGTQVMLANPLCSVGFGIVAWKFFKKRIFVEERYLHRLFGNEYAMYRERVPTRIPFIP